MDKDTKKLIFWKTMAAFCIGFILGMFCSVIKKGIHFEMSNVGNYSNSGKKADDTKALKEAEEVEEALCEE